MDIYGMKAIFIRVVFVFLAICLVGPLSNYATENGDRGLINLSSECSINTMWINKSLNGEKYIFPRSLSKYSNIKTIELLKAWHEGNPACKKSFWYDKNTVSDEQLSNTHQLLQKAGLADHIELRNIWDLKTVQLHPHIFGHPIYFYYLIDLLKAIIIDEVTDENGSRYGLFADINIIPWEHDILFNEGTKRILDRYGFVLSKRHLASSALSYENGFFILDGHNPEMKKAHRLSIIEMGIRMAEHFLSSLTNPAIETPLKPIINEQSVFLFYQDILKIYFILKGELEIPIDPRQCNIGTIKGGREHYVFGPCQAYPQEEVNTWGFEKFFNKDGNVCLNVLEPQYDRDDKAYTYAIFANTYGIYVDFVYGQYKGKSMKVRSEIPVVAYIQPNQKLISDNHDIARILKDVAQVQSHFG